MQKSAPTPGDPDGTPPGAKCLPSLLRVCAPSPDSFTTENPKNLPGHPIPLCAAPAQTQTNKPRHPCGAGGMLTDAPSGKGEPELFQRRPKPFLPEAREAGARLTNKRNCPELKQPSLPGHTLPASPTPAFRLICL